MNAERQAVRTCWASGGSILRRGRALDPVRAVALFRFLGDQALRSADARDRGGALFCARAALELADALIAADEWRRIAGGDQPHSLPLATIRLLRENLKSGPYG